MDEDFGRMTTRDDWNIGCPSQIVISSSSLICVGTGVGEHMNFATDHILVWATFPPQRQRLGPRFRLINLLGQTTSVERRALNKLILRYRRQSCRSPPLSIGAASVVQRIQKSDSSRYTL